MKQKCPHCGCEFSEVVLSEGGVGFANEEMIYSEQQVLSTLARFFCPWLESKHEPGTYEYAAEVQEMLLKNNLVTQITRDGDWYYCEPINE